MVKTTRRKKTSKLKRFPYIEVEGIENRYLDAALLRTCDSALEHALDDELKILKKAGISLPELKKHKYSQEELIEKVSPHLLENYDFYNFLVNKWDDVQNDTISNYFDEVDYTKFTAEDLGREIRSLYSSEMPSYGVINFLRFYKNGEFKELIKPLFEEENFVVEFFQQTGIKVEGIDIDWNSWEEEDDLFLDALNNDERAFDFLEDINPQAALKAAAKLMLDVSNRIDNMQEAAAYRDMYELEKEKKETLQANVDELTQEVKSKESHVKSLTKENRTLLKNVDTLNEKLDHLQKENGRLGGLVGDVRQENDALEKTNTTLEKRVATLEKEASSVTEKTKKQLEKDHDTKALKMQIQFDERTSELESQIKELKRLLDEEQAKTSALSVNLEEKEHQLKIVKNDLQVIEKERNDLAEQLKNAPAPTEEIPDDDDDLLFGFDEEDLEEFVEFDNKPTRN
jgi:predicted nuclease with TOPRIM domain